MDELRAAAFHRLARAPAATHVAQRVGCVKDMNWPHSANAAWDRAHPQARLDRGPTPLDAAVGLCIPLYWPLLAAAAWLDAWDRMRRAR